MMYRCIRRRWISCCCFCFLYTEMKKKKKNSFCGYSFDAYGSRYVFIFLVVFYSFGPREECGSFKSRTQKNCVRFYLNERNSWTFSFFCVFIYTILFLLKFYLEFFRNSVFFLCSPGPIHFEMCDIFKP